MVFASPALLLVSSPPLLDVAEAPSWGFTLFITYLKNNNQDNQWFLDMGNYLYIKGGGNVCLAWNDDSVMTGSWHNDFSLLVLLIYGWLLHTYVKRPTAQTWETFLMDIKRADMDC